MIDLYDLKPGTYNILGTKLISKGIFIRKTVAKEYPIGAIIVVELVNDHKGLVLVNNAEETVTHATISGPTSIPDLYLFPKETPKRIIAELLFKCDRLEYVE